MIVSPWGTSIGPGDKKWGKKAGHGDQTPIKEEYLRLDILGVRGKGKRFGSTAMLLKNVAVFGMAGRGQPLFPSDVTLFYPATTLEGGG